MSDPVPEASVPEATSERLVASALGQFLAAPPPGTPGEVVEALTLMAGNAADPLSPRLFFEAVEQAPAAISITDANATILYANRAFEVLTGYSRDEVMGQNEGILSNRATPPSVYQHLWRTIGRKQTWTGTLVNRTKQGGDYLAELTIAPVLDHQGRVKYFIGMHRDVTKVHELEGELRRQKARIETVLDAAPVVMAMIQGDGRVLLDNHEYKKLLGDLRGQEPAVVLCQALREQVGLDPLAECLAGRAFKDLEVSVTGSPARGPRWFSCSGTPVEEVDSSARGFFGRQNPGEPRLLLLANEVTGRRREIDRAQLENLRARLAEQQLAHGMREALAAAMYQIQAPMNMIRAAASLARGGTANQGTLAAMLEEINAAGDRTLETLRDALPEEPREAGVMVNVNDLLREVLQLETDRLIAAGVVVDWRPQSQLPELPGHRDSLRSLFKYLIDNAIQAIAESGREQRDLLVATRARDGQVEVVFQDHGRGIPLGERYRVFEPFYIGWRNRRGRAGMGLSLAQEIVGAHGGSIVVDPDYRDGCRIRLTLTAAPKDE